MTPNNIEKEYKELNTKNEWPALYQRIRNDSLQDPKPYVEANRPQNKVLNRYRDVNPYDHSRIVLNRGPTNYINANLIKVEQANRQYILTQGPLTNTISHFWLMVWEQESKAVLMLNKLIEKKQEKCSQYWPNEIGQEHILTMSDVGLSLEYMEQQDHSYYLTRILRLTDIESGKQRDVIQFHYITWPDFGVPTSPIAFLEFLRKVRDAGVLDDNVGPAIVHCSAGIGRSGTFCLVDSCLVLIEKFGIESVDVKQVLLEMRKYRMGLIQTPEQLRFSYQAIIEGAKQLLSPNSKEVSIHLDISNNVLYEEEDGNSGGSTDEDDEPPPLPPPRLDSLKKQNGTQIMDRPLPSIPASVSLNEIYDNSDSIEEIYNPSAPLPVVPADEELSSEDELEEEEQSESGSSDQSSPKNSVSPSELRHRKRIERKEQMEAQVRDMKRRQKMNEQWTQLKRSLYIPLLIGGSLIFGGGLIYFYFKN